MVYRWSKQMTATDARRPEGSSNMPLRLTRKGTKRPATWFRGVLFNNANWQPQITAHGQTEVASVDFDVTFHGAHIGQRFLTIEDRANRRSNNTAPSTHLHYDDAIKQLLDNRNCFNDYVIVDRDAQGNFSLTIQAAAPNPPHLP